MFRLFLTSTIVIVLAASTLGLPILTHYYVLALGRARNLHVTVSGGQKHRIYVLRNTAPENNGYWDPPEHVLSRFETNILEAARGQYIATFVVGPLAIPLSLYSMVYMTWLFFAEPPSPLPKFSQFAGMQRH
jgi:hypothetical protein